MSSNNNNTNSLIITRTNYEEYFLLYMDDELNKEERTAVENFLLLHPDLQEEMDLLLSTKLPQENFELDKEFLLAENMKLNAVDESLLLYIDDELGKEEKKEVEEKIKNNKDYSLQHELLLKTKLDASEKIIYPYKDELYRHTEKRIVFSAYWLRIAAAIIILLSVSAVLWFSSNTAEQPGNDIVNIPPVTIPVDKNNIEKIIEQPQPQEVLAATNKENDEKINTAIKAATTSGNIQHTSVTKEENKEVLADNNAVAVERKNSLNNTIASLKEIDPHEQFINTSAVTSPIAVSFNTIETPDEGVATNKGKIKGFLRKATRFIERTTNIKTTNEDNELLISAVAIKLN